MANADPDLWAEIAQMASRWLHYLEASLVGLLGGVARIAHAALASEGDYTRRQLVALLVASAGVGFVLYVALPSFPGLHAVMWLGGFLSYPLLALLIKRGPPWMTRILRGPGSPLDEE